MDIFVVVKTTDDGEVQLLQGFHSYDSAVVYMREYIKDMHDQKDVHEYDDYISVCEGYRKKEYQYYVQSVDVNDAPVPAAKKSRHDAGSHAV